MTKLFGGLALLGWIALCGACASTASAQEELAEGPKGLVISYRADLENRAEFREYLKSELAPRLRTMEANGEISDFRIFYSWYRQPDVWDGLVVLRFPTIEAVSAWNEIEHDMPGGLDAKGIALADPIQTSSVDLSWSENPDALREDEVYYIIPYEYANVNQYRNYLEGYVLPQFKGWLSAGTLTGYEIYMNRYPVGDPWDALFIQHYRNIDAFGRRQKQSDLTRETLRDDPVWKSWSDNKAGIRTETENSIAELIAH